VAPDIADATLTASVTSASSSISSNLSAYAGVISPFWEAVASWISSVPSV
jgi:hypothetical protein